MMPNAKADDTGRQCVPCLLNHRQAVIADAHAPQSLQPADRSLHYPAHFAQAASVSGRSLVELRFNPQPSEQPTGRLAVVARIGIQRIGMFLGPTDLAAN